MANELRRAIQGENAQPDNAPDATLAGLRAALAKPKEAVFRERVYHAVSGQYFNVVAMGSDGYRATEPAAVAQFAPNGQKISSPEDDAINLDAAYFIHGLRLSDGTKLDRQDAYQMATSEGWGESNLVLVTAIKKHNSRNRTPVEAIQLHWGLHQWIALSLNLLFDQGRWVEACKAICMTDNEIEALLSMREEYEALTYLRDFKAHLGLPMPEVIEHRRAELLRKSEED